MEISVRRVLYAIIILAILIFAVIGVYGVVSGNTFNKKDSFDPATQPALNDLMSAPSKQIFTYVSPGGGFERDNMGISTQIQGTVRRDMELVGQSQCSKGTPSL